jgi:phosphoserine aminotransferase
MPPRPFNFSAGPATLPEAVLQQASEEMLDWQGSGMSVMEMSHRGREFGEIIARAEADLRELLGVPDAFAVLFIQGGGLGENAFVPLNLSEGKPVDFVVSGSWSLKSAAEARRYAPVHIVASNEAGGHTGLPLEADWRLTDGAAYVHLCSNETIHGVEFSSLPDLNALGSSAPLVVDCSSHILSRRVDWDRVGLAFAGAQKNIGPAGLTLVFVRKALLGRALAICPSAFNFETVHEHGSMYNTPPTFAIYVAGLVFEWIKRQGGVAEMERRAIARSSALYRAIDNSGGYYLSRVEPSARSRMNVPFFLRDPRLEGSFLAGARTAGLIQLKGHKSLGGLRASLYNAMPMAGVDSLTSYMAQFAQTNG